MLGLTPNQTSMALAQYASKTPKPNQKIENMNKILGIHYGMANADYHSGPGVSKSQLDRVSQAPALLEWSRNAPNDESSTAAKQGTALHSLLLEPHLFERDYVVAPEFDARTKAGKEARANFAAAHAGRVILTADEWDALRYQRDSVMAHPEARALLGIKGGHAEASAYWEDPDTGLLCRCRPDWWPVPELIVDIKTTDDASKRAFSYSIRDYRYHVQDSFYTDGVTAATGCQVEDFVFLVVGKKRELGRYPVRVYRLDDESRKMGRWLYRNDLETVADCQRTGEWPGVEEISLPRF